jgi:hypothetical protein
MPRRRRILLADRPLHIVQRGINREPCFFADEDYHCYLHWLEEAARDCDCAIHAQVLMNRHDEHIIMAAVRAVQGEQASIGGIPGRLRNQRRPLTALQRSMSQAVGSVCRVSMAGLRPPGSRVRHCLPWPS